MVPQAGGPYTGKKEKIQIQTKGKKVNRMRGEKINQYTKETTTEQNEIKGENTRKRETMCETTHRKAKKKNKRDPDKCNKKQEM